MLLLCIAFVGRARKYKACQCIMLRCFFARLHLRWDSGCFFSALLDVACSCGGGWHNNNEIDCLFFRYSSVLLVPPSVAILVCLRVSKYEFGMQIFFKV